MSDSPPPKLMLLNWVKVRTTLFCRVENLTDRTIRENGILLPGATGTAGVKVRF